jgi:hypothetical protein
MTEHRTIDPGYVLDTDGDCHWYVIPKARLADWWKWINSPAWENGVVPDYATAVGGAPSLVVFKEYRIE